MLLQVPQPKPVPASRPRPQARQQRQDQQHESDPENAGRRTTSQQLEQEKDAGAGGDGSDFIIIGSSSDIIISSSGGTIIIGSGDGLPDLSITIGTFAASAHHFVVALDSVLGSGWAQLAKQQGGAASSLLETLEEMRQSWDNFKSAVLPAVNSLPDSSDLVEGFRAVVASAAFTDHFPGACAITAPGLAPWEGPLGMQPWDQCPELELLHSTAMPAFLAQLRPWRLRYLQPTFSVPSLQAAGSAGGPSRAAGGPQQPPAGRGRLRHCAPGLVHQQRAAGGYQGALQRALQQPDGRRGRRQCRPAAAEVPPRG
jgi:hypothetical protein